MTFVHLNLFQLILVPMAALFFGRSIVNVARGYHRRASALSAFIWMSAAVTVLRPNITLAFAKVLGIGRGTDLVLYIFVMAFLGAAFYFYNRVIQLEGAITVLVRDAALRTSAATGAQSPAKQAVGVPAFAANQHTSQAEG